MVNIVIVAYIVEAFREESADVSTPGVVAADKTKWKKHQ
jgi:hypothetical protein